MDRSTGRGVPDNDDRVAELGRGEEAVVGARSEVGDRPDGLGVDVPRKGPRPRVVEADRAVVSLAAGHDELATSLAEGQGEKGALEDPRRREPASAGCEVPEDHPTDDRMGIDSAMAPDG